MSAVESASPQARRPDDGPARTQGPGDAVGIPVDDPPGDEVTDRTDYPEGSIKAFLHPHDKQVQLPEEYIGHVMIFRTFDRVSYGLVMDGLKPVQKGARIRLPE